MAEIQTGLGVVWGVQGITFTAGIVSSTTGEQVTSLTYTRSNNAVYIKNSAGETVGRVDSDGKATLRITVVPSANSLTGAKTSLDAHLPPPGTKITVVDANGTIVDGDYLLNSATMNRTSDSIATVDLEMEKYDAWSTTVIS